MTAIFQSVPISNNPPKGGNRRKATTKLRSPARFAAKVFDASPAALRAQPEAVRPYRHPVREQLAVHQALRDRRVAAHHGLGLGQRGRLEDDDAERVRAGDERAAGHQHHPVGGQFLQVREVDGHDLHLVLGRAGDEHVRARRHDAIEELQGVGLDDEENIKDMRPQLTKLEVNLSDHHHY